MTRLFLNLVMVALCATVSLAQATAPSEARSAVAPSDQDVKRAEIRKLIELTGAANVSTDALRQVIAPIRAGYPQVPDAFWDTFIKEVDPAELIELVVPIYDRYYTRDDIRELTRFYESPVGQKTIKVLPKLSADAITAGQEWGRGVAERAMRKLKDQGFDKTTSLVTPSAQPTPPKSGSE